MDIEELAAQVAAMQQQSAEQQQMAERKGFIDKYGTMFSGDEGIGMAILGEMNRRGIGAAAAGADRVVQEILDQIRMEATAVLDKIKNDQATVSGLMDQVQQVQDSVAAATGAAAPGDGILDVPPPVPPTDAMPPELPPEGAPPPPDVPPPAPEGAPPPAEPAPAGGPAPAEGAPPEGEMPPIPPEQMGSDVRIKNLRQMLSDRRAKKIVKPAPVKPAVPAKPAVKTWTPSKSLVAAVKGEM